MVMFQYIIAIMGNISAVVTYMYSCYVDVYT